MAKSLKGDNKENLLPIDSEEKDTDNHTKHVQGRGEFFRWNYLGVPSRGGEAIGKSEDGQKFGGAFFFPSFLRVKCEGGQ